MKIDVQGISAGYVEDLFHDVTFTIGESDRIGVVGNNGAGKTTLLKCIANVLDTISGKITYPKGVRIAYIDQRTPEGILGLPFRDVVLSGLSVEDRDLNAWRVDFCLDTFGVPQEIRSKNIEALSGGWQRVSLIMRAWVSDFDLLILDEPTNHLDLSKILSLETWLCRELKDTPMIMVSHDRRFLDACTNKTLFLRRSDSKIYSRPYSKARELLFEEDRALEMKLERESKEMQRLRKSAHELRQIGVSNRSFAALRKSAIIDRRADAMAEALPEIHIEDKRTLKLSNRGTHASHLITLEDIRITDPTGAMLFHVGELQIDQGDRIVILGRNGSGKTRFIEALRAALSAPLLAKGNGISVSPSIVFSYIDQGLSQLPFTETLHGFISGILKAGNNRPTSVLVSAGFPVNKHVREIADLSPGERTRLAFLVLHLENPNFYLMDEPTNHLDISGQEQLEKEILTHGATAVLVSHDRKFIENIGTRFVIIENERLFEIESPASFYEALTEDTSVSQIKMKSREGWMKECSASVRPIRPQKNARKNAPK